MDETTAGAADETTADAADETTSGATDDGRPDAPGDATGAAAVPATPTGPGRGARRRALALGASLLAAVVVVGGAALLREPPAPAEGLVVLYGDSLSTESSAAFVEELHRTTAAEVVTRPVPGLAPCDAIETMREDLALDPDVVVVQYVGNNASPCTAGPDGEPLTGAALVERYEADIRAVVEMFATAGVRVVLVGGPDAPGLPGGVAADLADMYNEVVNEWAGRDLGRVRYADAAATVTDDHEFVERLPCRDDESPADGCEGGEVVVRNPDGIHFCPVEPDGLTCPVPSPGAARFGREMARVAALALDPGY